MRALVSGSYKLQKQQADEAITDGINISSWTVGRENFTMVYNVWDFAGQTVYYNTHQVTLSLHNGVQHVGLHWSDCVLQHTSGNVKPSQW